MFDGFLNKFLLFSFYLFSDRSPLVFGNLVFWMHSHLWTFGMSELKSFYIFQMVESVVCFLFEWRAIWSEAVTPLDSCWLAFKSVQLPHFSPTATACAHVMLRKNLDLLDDVGSSITVAPINLTKAREPYFLCAWWTDSVCGHRLFKFSFWNFCQHCCCLQCFTYFRFYLFWFSSFFIILCGWKIFAFELFSWLFV